MTNPPENIIVEARDVSFSYPEEPDRYVLNNLNLQVSRGECVAILGESGAGKTTLLKLLCGLLQPAQGQILFEGKLLQGPRNDISLIFQNYGLFPWKTVRENILLPVRLRSDTGIPDWFQLNFTVSHSPFRTARHRSRRPCGQYAFPSRACSAVSGLRHSPYLSYLAAMDAAPAPTKCPTGWLRCRVMPSASPSPFFSFSRSIEARQTVARSCAAP